MTEDSKTRIDRAARAYNEAAAALATELLAQVQVQDPQLAAKLDQAMAQGERVLLAWEMNPLSPAIWMASIDDYQQLKRIVTIPAKAPKARH